MYLNVHVAAAGHCGAMSQWSPASRDPKNRPPAEFEFRLQPGSSVGGKIEDEDGQPITGATVRLFFQSVNSPALTTWQAGHVQHWLWRHEVVTDAQGHWTCDSAPAEWSDASVQPRHADYYGPTSLIPMNDEQALRDQTAVATMGKGRSIRGRVVDPDGKAVAGAHVSVGKRLNEEQDPATLTDANGHFTLPHADPNLARILVIAPNLAPYMAELPDGDVDELTVALSPPRTLAGRVVDEDGEPITGANVVLHGWDDQQVWRKDWSKFAGADGRFAFIARRDVRVRFGAAAEKFASRSEVFVEPGDTDVTIVLRRAIVIIGRITDELTGKPIKAFSVSAATTDNPDWADAFNLAAATGADGGYTLTLNRDFRTLRLQFEAEGFDTFSSAPFDTVGGQQTFDAKLRRN